MCGISAIVESGETGPGHLQDLFCMHRTLAHRGPDSEGFLLVNASRRGRLFTRRPLLAEVEDMRPKLSLGFHRLSIQDRRVAANQPFAHRTGKHWIALNGEIYNFHEIRRLLEAEGYVFHTRSDTEVALAAYERWGTSCFEKFNGMWALLIVDLERGTLVGSRDRLGIKPLFYAVDAGRLLFASEPKAIAAVQHEGSTVRASRLAGFLRGSPLQVTAFSFFEGIQLVPAATFFEIDLTSPCITAPCFQPYWDLADYCCDTPPMSCDEAREEFASLLRSALAYQSVADVPVGSLLSGGLDSSMLTRLLALAWSPPQAIPRAFSVVFDDPAMDESRYIDAVLQMGGIDGRRMQLSPAHAWALVDEVTTAYGEPLLGHYLNAYYGVLGLAREHGVRVILDGQGADELLAGYNFLEAAALREKLAGWHLWDFAMELALLARQQHTSRLALLRSHVLGPYKHRLRSAFGGQQERQPYAWLDAEALAVDTDMVPRGVVQDLGHDRSLVNQLLYQLTKYTNLPYLLLFLDRLSMAHSIELRVPYLDHRLVELCFRLPASYKIAFGNRKRLLRDMARAYLPNSIIERTYKMGIASNQQWLPMRSEHGAALREMVYSTTIRQIPWLHHGALVRFVEDYLAAKHNDALAVWRLYTAWRWLEIFRPKIAVGPP